MIKEMMNKFEVTEQDSLSTAVVKGAVVGYGKGLLASAIGLTTFVVGIKALEYYVDNSQEEEEKENLEEKLMNDEDLEWRERHAKLMDDLNVEPI